MAEWPAAPNLIGKRIPRLDGLLKASGKAKYPSDVRPEGLLYGVMLYSPHAHARIKSIDVSAAQKMPGVKAVVAIDTKGTVVPAEEVNSAINRVLRYHGDDIAAVAAETEEQARDAIRAIKVEYEVLPHVATEALSMAEGAPAVFQNGNTRGGRSSSKGKPEEAMAAAEVTVEGTYSVPMITHVCLEAHGMTVKWEGDDKVVAWASTQAVGATAQGLAQALKLPVANVTVYTDYMGGGFGSKFGPELWGVAAARLAKTAGRPVTMFLDRVQEHLAGGNRPSSAAHVKMGANRDGTIVAVIAETHGTAGVGQGFDVIMPYVYSTQRAGIPNVQVKQTTVVTNFGSARAMRAPRHPQSCLLTEAAMDDMAEKLGIDPLEFRIKNLPQNDRSCPTATYLAELAMGAELIGWREKRKPRGRTGTGPIRTGLGVALHQWGGGAAQGNQVSCTINPDGSVELKTATQDIGTGARTILAIIAAEILGLQPTDIISNIGNSSFPRGQGSGGSTTTPSMSAPCYDAVTKARDALFKKVASAFNNAKPEDLSLKQGQLWVSGEPVGSWKDACRKLGTSAVSATGDFVDGLTSSGVGGCQFAEVSVDLETGAVKVKKIVAIQDSGLILDKLTWESQVYGGVIMGINYGLFEERVVDPTTGRMLNPDMEWYKLAGASDIPEIIVRAYEPDEIKRRGVIGVGEPPTISTAAAIGNAVSNAIGVRVPEWPMTPRNVLNALATASREGRA
jgi:xanthine dehydrogenase YagR molybdenum-binding subunit